MLSSLVLVDQVQAPKFVGLGEPRALLVDGMYVSEPEHVRTCLTVQRYECTHGIPTHQTTLPNRLRFEHIAVVYHDALNRLRGLSGGLLLLMRQYLCMEFCEERIFELAKRFRS